MRTLPPMTFGFRYTEEVVPPRCRKPRRVQSAGEVALSFTAVTDEEAVSAFTVFHDKNRCGKPEIEVYRWWNGRLFKEFYAQREAHGPYAGQRVEKFYRDPYPHTECTLGVWSSPWDYYHYRPKTERIATLEAWAASVLFVNGIRYAAAPEPRYVVQTFGLGNNHGGTGVFLTSDYNPNIASSSYFRLDQREQALAFADQIALGRGDDKSVPCDPEATVHIHLHEAIRLNPAQEHRDGDPFINEIEGIISAVKDPVVAGWAVMLKAAAPFAPNKPNPIR